MKASPNLGRSVPPPGPALGSLVPMNGRLSGSSLQPYRTAGSPPAISPWSGASPRKEGASSWICGRFVVEHRSHCPNARTRAPERDAPLNPPSITARHGAAIRRVCLAHIGQDLARHPSARGLRNAPGVCPQRRRRRSGQARVNPDACPSTGARSASSRSERGRGGST